MKPVHVCALCGGASDDGHASARLTRVTAVSEIAFDALCHSGRFGELWRARLAGRPVAARKYVAAGGAMPFRDPIAVLERAAADAQRVTHPALATTVAAGRALPGWILAEAWIDGSPLAEDSAAPLTRVVRIGADIGDALAAAHDAGLFHGGVRRRRVIVRPDGHAALVALGWAPLETSEADARWSAETPTSAREIDAYRAPEQYDASPASAATDVFALGCILYELAAGRHPFAQRDGYRTREAVRAASYRSLRLATPEAPAWLDELCAAAVERDPGRRVSAGVLAGALSERARDDSST